MRIGKIVLTDLVSEQLKLQEQIERLLNGKGNVDEEVKEIKELLSSLVLIENMIDKWNVMVMKPPILDGDKIKENG